MTEVFCLIPVWSINVEITWNEWFWYWFIAFLHHTYSSKLRFNHSWALGTSFHSDFRRVATSSNLYSVHFEHINGIAWTNTIYIFHFATQVIVFNWTWFLREDGFNPTLYSYSLYALNALGFTSCIYTLTVYDTKTRLNSIGYGAINVQVKQPCIMHLSKCFDAGNISSNEWFQNGYFSAGGQDSIIEIFVPNNKNYEQNHRFLWSKC